MVIMEMKLKKKIKDLQKEVLPKFIDLEDDFEDFKLKIANYEANDKFIIISPLCVRCNLCIGECPVDAITPSTFRKISKINDNCVKCEICTQTCPVSCIHIMEACSTINEENDHVEYILKEQKVPHRILRMEKIEINRENCSSCGKCTKFCPTNAISLVMKSTIEEEDNRTYPNLKDLEYPYIRENLCIACGSCANLCPEHLIDLQRTIGPIIETKFLDIDQDLCVGCSLCEDNCPVEAISLKNGKVILDNESCIKCNLCSRKCPVCALSLKDKINY